MELKIPVQPAQLSAWQPLELSYHALADQLNIQPTEEQVYIRNIISRKRGQDREEGHLSLFAGGVAAVGVGFHGHSGEEVSKGIVALDSSIGAWHLFIHHQRL